MDESFAEEKAEQVHLDNIETVDPDSTKPSEMIRKYLNNLIGSSYEFSGRASRTGIITGIEPKYDDIVQLSIDVGDDTLFRCLSKDSKKLAHLSEYHNIEKLSELEGEKIFY